MFRLKTLLCCFVLIVTSVVSMAQSRGVVRADAEGFCDIVSGELSDTLSIGELYAEGVKSGLVHNDTVRARRAYEMILERDSTHAPSWYQLSRIVRGRALDYIARAYELDSTNNWYSQYYGRLLIEKQRYDKALKLFQKRIDRGSTDVEDYRFAALLYNQVKLPFSAIALIDSATSRFGRIDYMSELKRELLLATYQTDKAIAESEVLVADDPLSIKNRVALAELYDHSRRDSLALVQYRAALKIDSANLDVLSSMADFYNKRKDERNYLSMLRSIFVNKRSDLAKNIQIFNMITADRDFYGRNLFQVSDLVSVLRMSAPRDPRVVEIYADHVMATDGVEKAVEIYKQHIEDEPVRKEYYSEIIAMENYLERQDSVNFYTDRAIKIFPTDAQMRTLRAMQYYSEKEYSKAIKCYKKSLQYASDSVMRSSLLGSIGDLYNVLVEEGGRRAAKSEKLRNEYYDEALKYDGDNALVLNNYAYFLSESCDTVTLRKAYDMSAKALKISSSNATYLDTFGWIKFKLGDFEGAKVTLQQAVSLDSSGSAEIFLHYGDVLDAMDQRFLAEIYWRKALEAGCDVALIEQRITPKE